MTRRTFLETGVAAAAARVAAATSADRASGARFIWYDSLGEGRNTFGLFRKTFTVPRFIESGVLHVFADTSYHLYVNGQFIEFGPVRCDPRFPLFDTHELFSLLRRGPNVIAIEVNFWGLKTFKAMPVRGGLIAWGSVKHDGGIVDLTTIAGSWRTTRARSRSRYAPKLSFALPAADLFEQTKSEDGWQSAEFDDSGWSPCVELSMQDSWGELRPRSIPFMSGSVQIDKPAIVLPFEKARSGTPFRYLCLTTSRTMRTSTAIS
jgi:alpha-L-rhamnosidase